MVDGLTGGAGQHAAGPVPPAPGGAGESGTARPERSGESGTARHGLAG